ncbi:MAG: hypothetical protein JXO48_07835 [Deltaproteobacteria bacterium]|nr:hypothetical protein [Deltaproteobacteria bacterium]
MSDIRVKAGKHVFAMIQDGGFDLDRVTTFIGPGAGPRWLIASGFDSTLVRSDLLGRRKPVLLVGSSAGALRLAAWLQPEFEKSYQALVDSYLSLVFSRRDNRRTILRAISNLIDEYVENDALPFALRNRRFRIAVITARSRAMTASEIPPILGAGLGAAFLANAVHSSLMHRFFSRVVFYNGPIVPRFCLDRSFRGETVALNEINFKHALLATSAIPLAVSGVRDIYGARTGVYRDGGLMDYHLNQRYAATDEEVTLFFHHQERIIPAWMDKKLPYRKPRPGVLDSVLMVHLSEDFVEKLPGGRVPDRTDFRTYAGDPETRIAYWRKAVELAAPLGEQFLDLVAGGRLRQVVEKL